MQNTVRPFVWWMTHIRLIRIVALPLLILMVIGISLLVHAGGGARFAWLHAMYLPVLLAGFLFGLPGGLVIGFLSGVAIGPFMPIDTTTGEIQDPLNWLYRTGFFMLIGALCGAVSDSTRTWLRHQAWLVRHDNATGLPNRLALSDVLSQMSSAKLPHGNTMLAVVGLQNAMELKSAFGFEVIEEVIRQCAKRYASTLPQDACIYRIDAEQIGILLVNHHDTRSGSPHLTPEQIIQQLGQQAHAPFFFNHIPLHADFCLGYVTFDPAAHTPAHYLQQAETALVFSHESGKESTLFDPRIITHTKENLSLLGSLTNAIKEKQLVLYYQPKVHMATGYLHSVEALIRWQHPERGIMTPADFILRAEQSTLINTITEYALSQAMAQIIAWRNSDLHIPVAVNISPRNLLQHNFADTVLHLLQDHRIDGKWLELEITESALMHNITQSMLVLKQLSDANITLSIDDFGTGHACLQYLHQLSVSHIKIDQSFVRRLPEDKTAQHIVKTIIHLAHKLNMKTIAEGVENEQTWHILNQFGCDIAQGFAIAHPMPAEELKHWHATTIKA